MVGVAEGEPRRAWLVACDAAWLVNLRLRTASPRVVAIAALVALAAGSAAIPAEAGRRNRPPQLTAVQLLADADPAVKAALDGPDGAAARDALDRIVARGLLASATLTNAMSHPNFAPYARRALVAFEQVQEIPGAVSTFARLSKDKTDSGNRGPAFELEVAAALGARVAQVGGTVDGDEVDLILKDGTRVEVKNDAPDGEAELSDSLAEKGVDQLELRRRFGDPVMLVANEPLGPADQARFRRKLGPAASMLVLDEHGLRTQLDREPETPAQLEGRLALARTRPPAVVVALRAAQHATARAVKTAVARVRARAQARKARVPARAQVRRR